MLTREQKNITKKNDKLLKERKLANTNFEKQDKKMNSFSNAKFLPAKEMSSVRIKIPDVDRGRGGPRSIIAVVINITEDGFYQLGNNYGTFTQ